MNYETRIAIAREWVSNVITRYERPAHLAHDKAKLELADMAEDLNAIIPANLTPEQYRSTLDKAARTIRAKNRTRSWPTIALVCQAIRESLPSNNNNTATTTQAITQNKSIAVAADRIRNNEPVSDSFLWGRLAHQLIEQTNITQAQLIPYQHAHQQTLTAIYGIEKATVIMQDLQQRHADANPSERLKPASSWKPDLAQRLDEIQW